jgi:hypothetical protein
VFGHHKRLRSYYTLEGECWIWNGRLNRGAYGDVKRTVDGRTRHIKAHRWIYTQLVGPIPEGMQLDHLCRNRACVNPDHLEPVTNFENAIRGDAARKLSLEAALDVHRLRGVASGPEVARRFGLSHRTVYLIWRGERYPDAYAIHHNESGAPLHRRAA